MGMDPYIGEISMFAGNYAPDGWFICDGRQLPITQYEALYSILSTTYGGDGRTTFALPDLRGRLPAGMGQGTGLSPRAIGDKAGAETVQLGQGELPSHAHGISGQLGGAATAKLNVLSDVGQSDNPSGAYIASHPNAFLKNGAAKVQLNAQAISVDVSGLTLPTATGVVGNGQAHQNMPPFLVINFIIAYNGIYPPRP